MKKILVLFAFLLISCIPSFADDLGLNDYVPSVENAWYGQKPITDENFEKTMQRLEAKKNKNKKKVKGKGLRDDQQTELINPPNDRYNLLGLPVSLITSDGIEIPVGHYKVVGVKENSKVYFDFYQAYEKVARVLGQETDNDFNEQSVNFIKIIPYDSHYLKLIYGSIEFNAYTYLRIKDTISDSN